LSSVRLDRGPRSATLVIDNPARGNALTPVMMASAVALLAGLAAELREEITPFGALVIRGAGSRAFCAGYDLSSLQEETRARPNLVIPELLSLVEQLRSFPVPTIAALNGHAIGGGALLASLCDLRYARMGTRFRIPTTRIGIVYPLAGLRRIVSLLGPGRALDVILLAEDVDAATAERWGLYQRVVDTESALVSLVASVVRDLADRAPLAVRGATHVVRGLADGLGDGALRSLHASWLAQCVASDDLGEGLSAARERRPPTFQGA
jgi:enoyl-CoA hydratase/carnithine racemase